MGWDSGMFRGDRSDQPDKPDRPDKDRPSSWFPPENHEDILGRIDQLMDEDLALEKEQKQRDNEIVTESEPEPSTEQADADGDGKPDTATDQQPRTDHAADQPITDDRHRGADRIAILGVGEVPADTDLKRLASPDITPADVNGFVDAQRAYLPWLPAFDHATDGSRRVLVSFAIGDSHAVERHSNYVDIEMAHDRVKHLQDPANTDPASQLASQDAFKIDRKTGEPALHRCGAEATFVNDPDAFATAIVNACEHPDVRAILDRTIGPRDRARMAEVEVPIADLLGPDGHKYCGGVQLVPIGGQTLKEAAEARSQWVQDQHAGRPTSIPAPVSKTFESFEEGTFLITLNPKSDRSGYAITTMYPQTKRDI